MPIAHAVNSAVSEVVTVVVLDNDAIEKYGFEELAADMVRMSLQAQGFGNYEVISRDVSSDCYVTINGRLINCAAENYTAVRVVARHPHITPEINV